MSASQSELQDKKLTPAVERVLKKAHRRGRVFLPGGFGQADCNDLDGDIDQIAQFSIDSDDVDCDFKRNPDFDTRRMIIRLLKSGFLRHGEYFNSYVLTPSGLSALLEHEATRPPRRKAIP